jgi:hypothetical protein
MAADEARGAGDQNDVMACHARGISDALMYGYTILQIYHAT